MHFRVNHLKEETEARWGCGHLDLLYVTIMTFSIDTFCNEKICKHCSQVLFKKHRHTDDGVTSRAHNHEEKKLTPSNEEVALLVSVERLTSTVASADGLRG